MSTGSDSNVSSYDIFKRKVSIDNHIVRSSVSSWFAGLTAGCLGIAAGHPFDTIKVRLQVGKPMLLPNSSVYKVIKDLYRGIGPPTLSSGLIISFNFFVYENSKRYLTREEYFHKGKTTYGVDLNAVFMSAGLSGIGCALITCPISVVKIQQQVASKLGMIQCAKNIFMSNTNPVSVFYRGFTPLVTAEIFGRGIYFWIYEKLKLEIAYLLQPSREKRSYKDIVWNGSINPPDLSSTLHVRMLSAASAGCMSWLFVYPLDVVKARLQLDMNKNVYSGAIDCFVKTYKEGGWRIMTRGLGFTMFRAAPVASIVLPIYEYSKEFVDQILTPNFS